MPRKKQITKEMVVAENVAPLAKGVISQCITELSDPSDLTHVRGAAWVWIRSPTQFQEPHIALGNEEEPVKMPFRVRVPEDQKAGNTKRDVSFRVEEGGNAHQTLDRIDARVRDLLFELLQKGVSVAGKKLVAPTREQLNSQDLWGSLAQCKGDWDPTIKAKYYQDNLNVRNARGAMVAVYEHKTERKLDPRVLGTNTLAMVLVGLQRLMLKVVSAKKNHVKLEKVYWSLRLKRMVVYDAPGLGAGGDSAVPAPAWASVPDGATPADAQAPNPLKRAAGEDHYDAPPATLLKRARVPAAAAAGSPHTYALKQLDPAGGELAVDALEVTGA